jgi:hypothetical protein
MTHDEFGGFRLLWYLLARELEEDMLHPGAPAEEEPPDIGSLLLRHK